MIRSGATLSSLYVNKVSEAQMSKTSKTKTKNNTHVQSSIVQERTYAYRKKTRKNLIDIGN